MSARSTNWTAEQRAAIDIRDFDTLVSAGAGSGKTSVLVARVVERLFDSTDPVDIDRILMVTFTEAAAAEMRERIRVALTDAQGGPNGRRASAQLALIGKAHISTLHGFCLQLLRRYFYVLGLDPRFTVLGEDESRLLKLASLDEVFEKMHLESEGKDADRWTPLVDHYGGARDDSALKEIVAQLFEYVQSLPEGEAWLDEVVAAYSAEDVHVKQYILQWQKSIFGAASRAVDQALTCLQGAKQLACLDVGPQTYLPSFDTAIVLLDAVKSALDEENWDEVAKAFKLVEWPRLKAPKGTDQAIQAEARALWDRAKDLVNRWKDGAFQRSLAEYIDELPGLKPIVEGVCELVRRYGATYHDAKRRQGMVDFSDLERMALEILKAEDGRYAKEFQDRFQEVMVDEYQDINPVQDMLLSLVARTGDSGGNRFLVGDVKQSIYRFRLADPTIFQEKFRTFALPENKGSARIDLQANFRSSPHILNAVNFIFRQLMHRETGGIEYGPEVFLRPGASSDTSREDAEVELHLIEGEDEDVTAVRLPIEREAILAGKIIKELAKTYRYRDIAVLMRSPKGRAGNFIEILEKMGVPAYTQAGTGFLKAIEVDVVVSLLRVVDNARQDIPLAAFLRSPIIGLSAEELAQIRIAQPSGDFYDACVRRASVDDPLGHRLTHVLETIDRWRTLARRSPVSHLLRFIYDETGYVDFVAGLPRGSQREANLWGLLQRAHQFDHFRTEGLDRFLRYVDDLTDAKEELAPPAALGEGEDVVQVMSVHQSKGLEFPVVLLVDLDRGFNKADTRRSLIFHRELGIGAAVIDRRRRHRYPSLPHRAIAEQLNQDTLEEELRLLYVATTRAKEKMIWIGSPKDVERRCAQWSSAARTVGWALPAGDVLGASSWLDWIGRTVARHRDGIKIRATGAGDLGADFYEPMDQEVWRDSAQFKVNVWSASQVDALVPEETFKDKLKLPIDAMSRKETLDLEIDPAVQDEVQRRYSREYPYAGVATAAKISVTEYARLRASSEDEDDMGEDRFRPTTLEWSGKIWGPVETRQKTTPAERGEAVHRLLALGDFVNDVDVQLVQDEVRRLVDAELLSPAQAEAIDAHAITQFFHTPLGRRVQQALITKKRQGLEGPVRIWREKAFMMLVDAHYLGDGAHDLPLGDMIEQRAHSEPTESGDEKVVVQGTIDVLLAEGQKYTVIDYKTDRVRPGEEEQLARTYEHQVKLYAQYVHRAAPKATVEAYLVFLATGRIVAVSV